MFEKLKLKNKSKTLLKYRNEKAKKKAKQFFRKPEIK